MPSTAVEVQDTEAEEPSDPGVPTAPLSPYTGVEPDPVTGGFFWWNDPLNPLSDVEPNQEWLDSITPEEAEPVDANEDV